MSSVSDYLDYVQYKRVLSYASWPDSEEIIQVSKVAGGGIALIGVIGFVIFSIMVFLPG